MKQFDIIFPLLVLICSALVFITTYNKILEDQSAERLRFSAIDHGSSGFSILSKNQCVGNLKITVNDQDLLQAEGQAELLVKHSSQAELFKLSLKATFNPLGQLFDAKFNLHYPGIELEGQGSQTSPIEVKVKAKLGPKDFDTSLKIPGPILLRKNKQQLYQLELPAGLESQSAFLGPMLGKLREELVFEVVDQARCQDQELVALDLNRFVPGLALLEQFRNN